MADGDVDSIRADIRARGFEADTDAQQLALLNQVQRRIVGSHRWPWTRVSANQSIVSGTSDYTYPTAAAHILSVRAVVGGAPIELLPVDDDELLMRRAQDNGRTGTPAAWARTSGTVIAIWPTPQAAGTLTVRYHQKAPLLTLGSDVPIIPPDYRDVLVTGSCEIMAQRERQFDAASAFRAEREERTREMMAQTGLEHTQGPVVVRQSGFYGPARDIGYDGTSW